MKRLTHPDYAPQPTPMNGATPPIHKVHLLLKPFEASNVRSFGIKPTDYIESSLLL
jgi:hypothetical protein